MGFANYYRSFIAHFAETARPLHRLTEKAVKFCWDDDCETSFKQLRQKLVTAPVLSFPWLDKPFILDTDASDVGIGAVLSQTDEKGAERVVAYGSKSLSRAERHYCVTRKELLAVVHFVRHFRPYLLGRQFILRTDHASLTWLANFKEPIWATSKVVGTTTGVWLWNPPSAWKETSKCRCTFETSMQAMWSCIPWTWY